MGGAKAFRDEIVERTAHRVLRRASEHLFGGGVEKHEFCSTSIEMIASIAVSTTLARRPRIAIRRSRCAMSVRARAKRTAASMRAMSSRAPKGFSIYSSAPARKPSILAVSPARAEEQNGDSGRALVGAQPPGEFEAVERRHHHIAQHQRRRRLDAGRQGGFAVGNRLHAISRLFQQA